MITPYINYTVNLYGQNTIALRIEQQLIHTNPTSVCCLRGTNVGNSIMSKTRKGNYDLLTVQLRKFECSAYFALPEWRQC